MPFSKVGLVLILGLQMASTELIETFGMARYKRSIAPDEPG